VHPNATLAKRALHGGCPVVRGEKWVATKWIRDKSFR
jgi:prolyl 4-hydroxylase